LGFFDKLMFWKKEEPSFDLGSPGLGGPGQGTNTLGMDMGFSRQELGMPPMSAGLPDVNNFRGAGDFQSQQDMNRSITQQLGPDYMNEPMNETFSYGQRGGHDPRQFSQAPVSPAQNIEVVSAKLDAIKATLDAVNQRLANLERVAYGEQEKKRYSW
jgi:hypothetical protein